MSQQDEPTEVNEKRQKLENEKEEEAMDCSVNAAEAANVMYPPRQCDVALLTAASLGQVEEAKRIMDDEDGDPCFQVFISFTLLANCNTGVEIGGIGPSIFWKGATTIFAYNIEGEGFLK